MKKKTGLNLAFALLAVPIGIALYREVDLDRGLFKNPALGILYLITFVVSIYLMVKRK